MKFILLGAGKIAEKFVEEERFATFIRTNLSGVVASRPVINRLEQQFGFSSSIPSSIIGDKKRNEEELASLIRTFEPNYLLSLQYPWILPSSILRSVSGRVVNLHNAKLPDFRGHNSITHEILNNETLHTSTLHLVDTEVDRGFVLKTREIPIYNEDTAYSIWSRSINSAMSLLEDWIFDNQNSLNFFDGQPVGAGGRYYSKNLKNQKQIPNGASVKIIDKWARAFWFPPHEPAFMLCNKRKLYVLPNTFDYRVDLNSKNLYSPELINDA